MGALVGSLGMVGFFVFFLLLVVALFRRKKKRNYLIGMLVCFILFIVGIAISPDTGSAPDSSEAEPNNQDLVEELSDEEKAAKQIEEATVEFQDGDYMSAIEICNAISTDYPNTETAANIENYLSDQFAQFPHFKASDLMSEYDANVVNADEKYTDTVMIVSGQVSSIGKTNRGSNLTVLLNSGTYFYGVQLNFKTSQTDSVAALREGDSITAIGKCTGQSGKVLLLVDANNVMIENCYIIQ